MGIKLACLTLHQTLVHPLAPVVLMLNTMLNRKITNLSHDILLHWLGVSSREKHKSYGVIGDILYSRNGKTLINLPKYTIRTWYLTKLIIVWDEENESAAICFTNQISESSEKVKLSFFSSGYSPTNPHFTDHLLQCMKALIAKLPELRLSMSFICFDVLLILPCFIFQFLSDGSLLVSCFLFCQIFFLFFLFHYPFIFQ